MMIDNCSNVAGNSTRFDTLLSLYKKAPNNERNELQVALMDSYDEFIAGEMLEFQENAFSRLPLAVKRALISRDSR